MWRGRIETGIGARRVYFWALLSLAAGPAVAAAQTPQPLLDRAARLEVVGVTLQEALRTLHRSSGVAIAFSPDRLPPELRVSCRCLEVTVRGALDRLLEGTDLTYQEGRRQILIRPAGGEIAADDPPGQAQGVIEGRLTLGPDGRAGAGVTLSVRGIAGAGPPSPSPPPEDRDVRTDGEGRFVLAVPAGRYCITTEALGVTESGPTEVTVTAGQITRVTLSLEVTPIPLEELVVSPSTFGMLRTQGPSGQILTRTDLEAQPHPGNDIVRAVERLPGVATTDYSAKPFVRGARAEEVLIVLDGLELYDPYHIKYWDGSISIVDVEAVGEVSLTTGGFTTEYGDRSAGVLAMRSADPPPGPARTTVGLDFLSSILKTEGTFHDGKGSWSASARRGFLAFVFDLMNLYPEEDLRPAYWDVFSRARYEVQPGHRLSAQILHAGDDNRGVEVDSTIYRIRYGNSYGWLNWEADFGDDLSARTVASVGRLTQNREGTDYLRTGGAPVLRVADESATRVLGLRQDWRFRSSERTMLKGGFDLRWGTVDYDYFRARRAYVVNETDPNGPDVWLRHDTLLLAPSRAGSEVGVYLAGRLKLTEALTVESGLRYDRQSHTGEHQVSPRIQAAWELRPGTTLRGAWGHYHQPHGINELWVGDADTTFYAAQKAEHRIVGLDHRWRSGYSVRLEAYQRLLSDPLPEYRWVARNMGALWEEAPNDRVFVHPTEGRAEGIELFVRSPAARRLTWSGSYTLSRTEERVRGRWVPRPLDQRHALNLQIAFRPTPDWSVAAAWVYHSPWPFTEVAYRFGETVHGVPFADRYVDVLNQGRLMPYQRLDFRASRRLREGRSDLLLYVDVFNVLNRENALDYEQNPRWFGGVWKTDESVMPQLTIIPSLGLKWTF
jgi:hypothetical protein